MLINFRELFPKFNLYFNGVLHIGANIGEEAPVYEELGIHKQVWIEANPEIFKQLEVNIADYPSATAHNYCIGDEDGKEVMFHVSNNGSQSSSILDLKLHKVEHPNVDYVAHVPMVMRRVDKLGLDLTDCDLLNVDLQGADLLALKGLGDIIKQFRAVYIEVNKSELYEGCALIEDVDFYLGSFGFQRVETEWARNKTWGDALYIKVN
jgi:FkbM family methyltransferase